MSVSIDKRGSEVKTKIVATVGPATATFQGLKGLVEAGVDVFRLNFAHGTPSWFTEIVQLIRRIQSEKQTPLGILADLAGPKIRLNELPGDALQLADGERLTFVPAGAPQDSKRVSSTYQRLIQEVKPGDKIILADGAVCLKVTGVTGEEAVCLVEQGGVIRSRQGINLPGAKLSVPCLTEKDLVDLDLVVALQIDYVGLSFVRSAEDIKQLQQELHKRNPIAMPRIVPKIEKPEAIEALESILALADAVMIARGDLGVEIDLALVPGIQKQIIKRCNALRIPVITATQMLDSMQRNSRPTRAEAADVFNAVLDGTDAVMLSGETAAGEYPVESVRWMGKLAAEAERIRREAQVREGNVSQRSRALEVTEAVACGAQMTAEVLNARLMVVCTRTGRSALALSQYRSRIPILGMTDSRVTAQRMALYWGVTPLHVEVEASNVSEIVQFVLSWGRKQKLLEPGDQIVILSSSHWSAIGHDSLLVHTVAPHETATIGV